SLVLTGQREHPSGVEIPRSAAGRIEHALERARTEAKEHAWIERHLIPEPVGVAGEIAGGHLPDRAELSFHRHVPLLDARRVDVRIDGAIGAKRQVTR